MAQLELNSGIVTALNTLSRHLAGMQPPEKPAAAEALPKCVDMTQELLQDGVVALELQSLQYRKMQNLRELAESLKKDQDDSSFAGSIKGGCRRLLQSVAVRRVVDASVCCSVITVHV